MGPREIARIVNDSRRIALMREYVANHGGKFDWNQHTGWTYIPEQVVDNRVEKTERRAEQRQKEAAKKGFFRRRKNEETE